MSFARPSSLVKDVTRINSQRRFLAQYSVATLLRHCFEWLQHCMYVCKSLFKHGKSSVKLKLKTKTNYNCFT